MKTILGVRVPDEVDERLSRLAQTTGRSKSYYVREAIVEHLADLEDIYLADHVRERIRRGEERVFALDEVEKRLGLAD
jgi:RHH-type transcriptional regulator, rel operon repressor / antitoxin RelB